MSEVLNNFTRNINYQPCHSVETAGCCKDIKCESTHKQCFREKYGKECSLPPAECPYNHSKYYVCGVKHENGASCPFGNNLVKDQNECRVGKKYKCRNHYDGKECTVPCPYVHQNRGECYELALNPKPHKEHVNRTRDNIIILTNGNFNKEKLIEYLNSDSKKIIMKAVK